MRVKMLTQECGPLGNFAPGDERTVNPDHGRQLIAARHAVLISSGIETAVAQEMATAVPPPSDTAVVSAPEKAVIAKKKGKRR